MNANTLDALTFDQLVPSESKYLRKDDVGEDGMILTIAGFNYESIKGDDGTPEDKVIMHFVEDVKPMVLNKTNSQLLAVCTGVKVAGQAKGKKIVVYNDPTVSFGGRVTGGLRIKKIPGAPRAPQGRPVARPVERVPGEDDDKGIDFDDELPPM